MPITFLCAAMSKKLNILNKLINKIVFKLRTVIETLRCLVLKKTLHNKII